MASSSYGMTLAGFIPKRLADIQNDMNASIALIVDPHTGEYPFQNVTDDAVLQQVVGVFASALEEAWEAARLVRYSSEEAKAERIREERDRRIAETDYLVATDYPLAADKMKSLKAYRQALRDLPQQEGFPWSGEVDDPTIPWPVLNFSQ